MMEITIYYQVIVIKTKGTKSITYYLQHFVYKIRILSYTPACGKTPTSVSSLPILYKTTPQYIFTNNILLVHLQYQNLVNLLILITKINVYKCFYLCYICILFLFFNLLLYFTLSIITVCVHIKFINICSLLRMTHHLTSCQTTFLHVIVTVNWQLGIMKNMQDMRNSAAQSKKFPKCFIHTIFILDVGRTSIINLIITQF